MYTTDFPCVFSYFPDCCGENNFRKWATSNTLDFWKKGMMEKEAKGMTSKEILKNHLTIFFDPLLSRNLKFY